MAIITYSDVFTLMGTASDVQTSKQSLITSLITAKQLELENMLGRKLEDTAFSSIVFQNGLNCKVIKNKLFLEGIYRDVYSITSIYEDDQLLTASTAYEDGKDYVLITGTGVIEKLTGYWSTSSMAIKITGKLGLVTSGGAVLSDLKQCVTEMVAAASGLWVNNVLTEQGTIETVRIKISDSAQKIINSYRMKL